MLKRILALLLNKVGLVNLSLRISEFILNQLDMEWEIPYEGYANDIINQVDKIAEDGKVTTDEMAKTIKFFRTGKE